MARPRSAETRQFPEYVYRDEKRGVVYFRPPKGARVTLAPLTASKAEVWAAYNAHLARHVEPPVPVVPRTIAWMIDEYLVSEKFHERKAKTQLAYHAYATHLKGYPTRAGIPLGEWPIASFTRSAGRVYLDERKHTQTGRKVLTIANREMEFLSTVFTWASQRMETIVDHNPLLGLEYEKETPRHRYVTDEEYDAVLNLARHGHGSYVRFAPWLWMIMELMYLCRLRANEAYRMTRQQALRPDGVYAERGKGSKSEITLWSPRLREVVDAALGTWPKADFPGPELIRNHKGKAIGEQNYKSCSQRLIKKALELGLITEGFHFHDIKAKGVTDHPAKESGHKSAKMKAVYDRLPSAIVSTR